ncbi:MAG: hypothetical protein ACO1SV_08010 [Fimbriimonas sp.]
MPDRAFRSHVQERLALLVDNPDGTCTPEQTWMTMLTGSGVSRARLK